MYKYCTKHSLKPVKNSFDNIFMPLLVILPLCFLEVLCAAIASNRGKWPRMRKERKINISSGLKIAHNTNSKQVLIVKKQSEIKSIYLD